MFDNLEDIVVHYDEIMAELAGGDVANDQNRFRKLMKEQSDLAPLVETYGEYKKAKQLQEDALEMLEMNDENIEMLIKELQGMGKYRNIIIDSDLCMGSRLKLYSKLAHKIILVFEESTIGMKKMSDLNKALQLLENGGNIDITNKITVIFNKVKDVNHVSVPSDLSVREFVKKYNSDDDLTDVLRQVPFLENLR